MEIAQDIPQSVWQRDMFQAAFSDDSVKAMAYSQSISTWIAAKMTAVLQLTDTDYAQSFKAACRRSEQTLRSEIMEGYEKLQFPGSVPQVPQRG